MESTNGFPLDKVEDITAHPERYRLVEHIPIAHADQSFPVDLAQASDGDYRYAIFLDTETTGLDHEHDNIIELGMARVKYSLSDNKLIQVEDMYTGYQDPGMEIPELITKITGISQDMVEGQSIDDDEVAEFIATNSENSPLIIAHNARFDRPFFESRFPQMAEMYWTCSQTFVDWFEHGFESAKLEYLLLKSGWWFSGHRAGIDALATCWLFHHQQAAFAEMLERSRQPTWLVRAWGAPFDVKDSLRAQGYRWNADTKGVDRHWYREVTADQVEQEREFLVNLYAEAAYTAEWQEMTARTRFKG